MRCLLPYGRCGRTCTAECAEHKYKPSMHAESRKLGVGGVEKHHLFEAAAEPLHAEVNLVTALVPSDTACLASSPGRIRRTCSASGVQMSKE
jgi:hypothetical protein